MHNAEYSHFGKQQKQNEQFQFHKGNKKEVSFSSTTNYITMKSFCCVQKPTVVTTKCYFVEGLVFSLCLVSGCCIPRGRGPVC